MCRRRERERERERGAACTATEEEEESVQDRQNCRREGVAMGNETRHKPGREREGLVLHLSFLEINVLNLRWVSLNSNFYDGQALSSHVADIVKINSPSPSRSVCDPAVGDFGKNGGPCSSRTTTRVRGFNAFCWNCSLHVT